jgi:hypothetical protein
MENYTQNEALMTIFKEKNLNAKTRVSKSRYSNNELSQKSIDKILIENGFQIVQEKLYARQ